MNITTIGTIDMRLTKTGYKINDFFIELSSEETKRYSGRKVRVTGELLVIPAIDTEASLKIQGSAQERKLILNPDISIVSE